MVIADQLAFDFELDQPEPLYYDSNSVATHCRDCHRPIKGHYKHSAGGANGLGHYVICDLCVEAAWVRARENAPYLSCGLHKHPYNDEEHAVECLELRCPFCGLTEDNARELLAIHNPIFWALMDYGLCYFQRDSWSKASCCRFCNSYTWGKAECPNRTNGMHS